MVTLAEIRSSSPRNRFPHAVLEGSETALVLFAAAFHGAQDAIWIHDAGLTATCVDRDAAKLGEMILAYPEGWEFVTADVFAYAELTERKWDVVTVDCFTDAFERCAEMMDVWCSLARNVVILGSDGGSLDVPAGWQVTDRVGRSGFRGGVFWTVVERC